MRALASSLLPLALLPLVFFPGCSTPGSETEGGCGKCGPSCESEERELAADEHLGWEIHGAAGAPSTSGGSVAETISSIEGNHSSDARYIYDEALSPTDLTVSIESLGDPTLVDNGEDEYCDEDRLRFAALVGFTTADGRFAERAEGKATLTPSGAWTIEFEMSSADLQGDFDPSDIEDLDDGDHQLRFSVGYSEGKFAGQVSLTGPTMDLGDGVAATGSYTVLRIPAVEE